MKEVAESGTGSKAEADQLVGRIIAGKYQLERYISGGSSGAVYRARHNVLEKPVALKILDADLALSADMVEYFKREAKAASRLDHPNSVRILDFGSEPDGLLYIVMELVEGPDLLQILDEQFPLEPTRVVEIMSQILGALAQAHELGVIHRDLKPENVLVLRGRSDDGQPTDIVKVCDFGVAQLSPIPVPAVPLPRTEPGRPMPIDASLLIGTPEYMAPEQARGEPLDPRTDVYGAGMMMFQLLTGQLPFTGDHAGDVAMLQCYAPLPRPSSLAPVPAPLEAVCLKALNKDPAERYQSAREMRAALRRVAPARRTATLLLPTGLRQAAEPAEQTTPDTMSPPPALAVEEPAQPRRKPKLVFAAVALLAPAIALAAYLGTRGASAPDARANASAAQPVAGPAPRASQHPDSSAQPGFHTLANSVLQAATEPAVATVATETAAQGSVRSLAPRSRRLERRSSSALTDSRAAAPASAPEPPASDMPPAVAPATADGASAPAGSDWNEPALGGPEDLAEMALGALPQREAEPAGAETAPAVSAPAPKPPVVRRAEPLTASVRIADLTVRGSVATSVVERAIQRARSGFSDCYGHSARATGRNGYGPVHVEVEFDEYGRARRPRADGGALPGLDRCMTEVAGRLVTSSPPDTGTVKASWRVDFVK